MSFNTRTSLIAELKAAKPSEFLEQHIYDCVPFVFGQDRKAYIAWRRILAGKIEVDPACILIVGSAAVGWSLNPAKNFKEFDRRSDIDVAVISAYHFTVGWRFMRSNPAKRLSLDNRTRNAWDEHVTNYIYFGAIATDKLLGILPFGAPWQAARTAMMAVPPTLERDVKFRVYTDFEALRSYQLRSLTSLQQQIVSQEINA